MNAEQLSFNFDDYKSKPLCEVAKDLKHLDVEKLSSMLIEWQNRCNRLHRNNIKLQLENFKLNQRLLSEKEQPQ